MISPDVPAVWALDGSLVLPHRYGSTYDVIRCHDTGWDVSAELSDLPADAVRLVPAPDQAAQVDRRLNELAALQEGWDSYGAYPMQPGIRERVTTLLGHLRGEPRIGLTPSGGGYLHWGADEDVIIELEPDGTASALIEERDLIEPIVPAPELERLRVIARAARAYVDSLSQFDSFAAPQPALNVLVMAVYPLGDPDA